MLISEVLKGSGRDPEKEVYRLLVLLRCKPFLRPYIADMMLPHKMGPDQKFPLNMGGFHTLYPGMDFRCDDSKLHKTQCKLALLIHLHCVKVFFCSKGNVGGSVLCKQLTTTFLWPFLLVEICHLPSGHAQHASLHHTMQQKLPG